MYNSFFKAYKIKYNEQFQNKLRILMMKLKVLSTAEDRRRGKFCSYCDHKFPFSLKMFFTHQKEPARPRVREFWIPHAIQK
jgi:hypothetical protein